MLHIGFVLTYVRDVNIKERVKLAFASVSLVFVFHLLCFILCKKNKNKINK